ncbi:SDR family oxidoreductase [Stenotrophomonas sp. MMGLT7]|uniref:SDR family oxidoreductase n=1 Tax=Stenotrophomonas sp. MMGLT7 TaxID=2901227 RepID=UPI001E2EE67E|nr:SDR family oxidoreductase [Stenotrophomonas sp. MMGLT7]MCD7097954.1 SDR family oxidoreductase [Stenotrophomonas sp. MMGLT7]
MPTPATTTPPPRRALLFGGSGQIGARVIDGLLLRGWQVQALSRQPRPPRPGLHWLAGELATLAPLPGRYDAILSCGPLDHFARWYAQAGADAPRVLAFGSTSVEVKRDSADPYERDLAARLHRGEEQLFAAAAGRDAAATLLRPTLVYGAGQDRTLAAIAALARRTGFFVLPRDARGRRQPVHVQDLADAALAALDAPASFGQRYALGGGEVLDYRDMVARVLASLHPPARLLTVPAAAFSLLLSGAHALGRLRGLNRAALRRMREDLVFDIEPARRDFGYGPREFRPQDAIAAPPAGPASTAR